MPSEPSNSWQIFYYCVLIRGKSIKIIFGKISVLFTSFQLLEYAFNKGVKFELGTFIPWIEDSL